MSIFMNKVINGTFAPEFNVLMLKEISTLVRSYIYKTRKQKAKLVPKYVRTLK